MIGGGSGVYSLECTTFDRQKEYENYSGWNVDISVTNDRDYH